MSGSGSGSGSGSSITFRIDAVKSTEGRMNVCSECYQNTSRRAVSDHWTRVVLEGVRTPDEVSPRV